MKRFHKQQRERQWQKWFFQQFHGSRLMPHKYLKRRG